MAAQRPGAGSLLLSQASVRWGRGEEPHVRRERVRFWTREKGLQVSFCLWMEAVDPLRGAGWGSLSQVWSRRGTLGLAAPIPPVVAQRVVLEAGWSPTRDRNRSASLPWLMPTRPALLPRGPADPSFFPGRCWRGCSRGVSVWLRPAGVVWTPPSSASTCSAGRSGGRSPPPPRSG